MLCWDIGFHYRWLDVGVDQLLSHWLKIRPDERRRTALLFLFLFFSTSFIIIGRTARDALLLSSIGIEQLPLMYVGIALGSSVLVGFSSRIDGRGSPYPLLRITLFGSMVGLLLLRAFISLQQPWSFSALYIFMEVAGSMLSVLFWTFANEAFSTREAKRLFSVIGSGGVMAGTVCGFGGAWLAPILGTPNLLFICVLSLLICVFLARAVHGQHRTESVEIRAPLVSTAMAAEEQRYVFALGALAVVVAVSVNVIDFQFKLTAREHYSGDALASYFGILYGGCGLASFLSHLFFTNRILTRGGILPALLMLPGSLLIGAVFQVTSPGLMASTVLKGADLTQRYSLNDTCMQLLYLPLPVPVRRRVKAVVEGLAKPMAIAATGALLFVVGLDATAQRYLAWALLGLLLAWILLSLLLRQGYVAALLNSLNRRGSLDEEIPVSLSDVASTQALLEALRSGEERIVLGALELIPAQQGAQWQSQVVSLMLAPSREVRIAAWEFFRREDLPMPANIREQWLVDLDDELRAVAVETLAGGGGAEYYLKDPASVVRARAIVGLVRRAVDTSSGEALGVLGEMQTHRDPGTRLQAAWVMGELGGPEAGLAQLLQDRDIEVRREAIEAVGKARLLGLAPQLLELLTHPTLGDEAAQALGRYGELVLSQLLGLLPELESDELHRLNVFSAFRAVGTRKVAEELVRRLPSDRIFRHEMLQLSHSLVRARTEGALRIEQIRAPLLVEIQDCYQWGIVLQALGQAPEWELLTVSLDEERKMARERALLLLGHVYPVRPIQALSDALATFNRGQLANAIEVLDEIIEPELRVLLMPLLEPTGVGPVQPPPAGYFSLVSKSSIEWCRIFTRGDDRWLALCALAVAGKAGMQALLPDLRSMLSHPDRVMREVAFSSLLRLTPIAERTLLLEQAEADLHPAVREIARHGSFTEGDDMITSVDKVLFLKRVDLFSQLPGRELLNLAAIAELVRFAEGDVIFEEGSEGDSLFLILSGRVRVTTGGRLIASLGPRECFGEMAILDRASRSATVTAAEPLVVLKIERDSFYELLAQKREIALGIIRILVARLRGANER